MKERTRLRIDYIFWMVRMLIVHAITGCKNVQTNHSRHPLLLAFSQNLYGRHQKFCQYNLKNKSDHFKPKFQSINIAIQFHDPKLEKHCSRLSTLQNCLLFKLYRMTQCHLCIMSLRILIPPVISTFKWCLCLGSIKSITLSIVKYLFHPKNILRWFLKGILSLLMDLKSRSALHVTAGKIFLNIVFSQMHSNKRLNIFATQAPQTIRASFGAFSQI